jgi:plasmid stabilization system protein ParE
MKYTIMFRLKALEDYDGARDYYDQTSVETKEKFEKAISEGLDKISLNPEAYGF